MNLITFQMNAIALNGEKGELGGAGMEERRIHSTNLQHIIYGVLVCVGRRTAHKPRVSFQFVCLLGNIFRNYFTCITELSK